MQRVVNLLTGRSRRRGGASRSSLVARRSSLALLAVLLAALLLNACTFSTDTAATVGTEEITVGEFNAAVARVRALLGEARWQGNEDLARRFVMDQLVDTRLVQLEAARNHVAVSDAELDAKLQDNFQQFAQQTQQQGQQQRDALASGGAQQLRPVVNAYGGAQLADKDLTAIVGAEVDRMQAALDARGQTFPGALPDNFVADHAAALAGALAAKGVHAPAAALAPTVGLLADQLALPQPSVADQVQQQMSSSGYASGDAFNEAFREQLLEQKLQPLYVHKVDAVTLQQLITDSPDKAQQALDKARAGTPFTDLDKQYAIQAAQSDQVVNGIGSTVPAFFKPEIRALFPSLQEGTYSNVLTVPSQAPGGQPTYAIFHITKVEQRDPTADEIQQLRDSWLEGLRARYAVTENPALNLPPHQP
jgi:hypothetical protein